MIKSLQSKMILVMFIFILLVILFSAVFSILKMEQVYYRGFAEEMLNTISGFGITLNDNRGQGAMPIDNKENMNRVIANFNIYFSLNSNIRNGTIFDNNFDIIFSSKEDKVDEEIFAQVKALKEEQNSYQLINKLLRRNVNTETLDSLRI